jgi:aminoglycoside 6'-N-acetyltransferase I
MLVRTATESDLTPWAALRAALWPSLGAEQHLDEITAALRLGEITRLALVVLEKAVGVVGFAEASLRYDYVNGCETSPVAFVEGIYVTPEYRGVGMARALASAIEDWARERGCTECASDALLGNEPAHAFHEAVGFVETERVVYFRKRL